MATQARRQCQGQTPTVVPQNVTGWAKFTAELISNDLDSELPQLERARRRRVYEERFEELAGKWYSCHDG